MTIFSAHIARYFARTASHLAVVGAVAVLASACDTGSTVSETDPGATGEPQAEGSVGAATEPPGSQDGTAAQPAQESGANSDPVLADPAVADPAAPPTNLDPATDPTEPSAEDEFYASEPHPVVAENGALERGCSEGAGQDCADLGNLLLEAEGDLWDGEMAVGLFQQGCDLNNPHACNHLGWYRYMSGIGGEVDVAMASQLFRVACDGGYVMSCNNLGNIYLNGQGVVQDLDRARAFYLDACEGEIGFACTSLGLMALHGNGLPQDVREALNYMRLGCENDDPAGCNDYAYYGFIEGQAGEVDYDAAREILEPACEDGALMACNNLGNLYLDGNGVAQDHERARSYYIPACDAGIRFACETLSTMGY